MTRDSYPLVTSPFQPRQPERISAIELSWSESKRPPLHPQEGALVGITALHLCFLPWALGAMHAWSQLTSLGCALTGFILAVLPRTSRGDYTHTPETRQWPAARLLHFPVFWATAALLGYIAVQGLNPVWRFFSNENSWWLEPLDPIGWLPSSVDAPFARSNSWRTLTIFSSLSLLVGSVWVGFSRRKSYHTLFTLLAVNAGLLAVFGLVQRLTGAKQIFWSYVPSNDNFAASFIYPNHAGPYFNLMVALAVGLAWWHHQRARHQLENPGAATVFVLITLCCCGMVIFSSSRMSIILLLTLVLFVGGRLVWRLGQRTGPARHRPEWWPLALTLTVLLGIGAVTLGTEKVQKRFVEMAANPSTAGHARTLARQAAGDMFRDHWLFGWGAGCFRYGFPKYTKKYPALHYLPHGPRSTWEHAHNDLLQFPVELGVAGVLPLVGILGYGSWQLCRHRFWRNVVPLFLVVGCTLVLLHAWVDFVFQNPAILLTWSVLLAGALRWTELDRPGGRQAKPSVG